MKYRKKPVVIEAIQWKENTTEIIQFCGNKCSYNVNNTAWEVGKRIPNEELIIHTLEGNMIASRNDYIIKGIKGEVYPCKPDIFEKTYEEVGGMNVLEKILEEMENESKLAHEEMRRCARKNPLQFDEVKGYARAMEYVIDTIRSHMDKALDIKKHSDNHNAFVVKNMTPEQFKELAKNKNSFQNAMERFNRNKGCMVYDVDSNVAEDIKPISKEYIDECKEVAKKYKKNTDINNKCSDCSRRKWYQIGYRDGENIDIEKIKVINKEMEDYLFEKYCIEGFDEVLDGIFKKYLELGKDINVPSNEDWIPVEERLPEERVDVLVDFGDDSPVIAWYSCDNNTDIWRNSSTENVIHIEVIAWKPLPKPYKPKEKILV